MMSLRLAVTFGFVCLLCFCYGVSAKLKGDDCEVCIRFLNNFTKRMKDSGIDSSRPDLVEVEFLKACKEAKGKEERFCYYIGAAETSATKLVREVAKPLSFGKPPEKICEDLKKKDGQICELRYEKVIDVNTVDLGKLRVKELKKILNAWGEDCRGCAEKYDFVSKINEVKHKHIEL